MTWTSFRHSLRALFREPGFTAFAILTLALGIGASTAMFSVFNGLLLAPVPYADPHRVVSINTRYTNTGFLGTRTTGGDWMDLAAAHDIFEQVARHNGGEMGVQLRDRAEWAQVSLVSPNFFQVFNVAPILGRFFNASDAQASVVVSPVFARRAYGSADAALGQVLHIDARAYQVIGVTPPDFAFPDKAEVWMADAVMPESQNRNAFNYLAVAKLKNGLTPEAAAPRLDVLSTDLAQTYPDDRYKHFIAVPLRDNMIRSVRSTVVLLMSAVGLLLLISCANVAHLLLARAAARTREFAVRTALGASRARMLAQMLTESLALGLLAGAVGIAAAYAGVRAVLLLAPEDLPRMDSVAVDWRVLLFGIAVSIVSSVLFGLAPAWQASRHDVQDGLRASSSRGIVGARSARIRNALVACEIALSFTLAAGAALLIRSFIELNSVSLGFHPENILVVYAHAPADTLNKALAAGRTFETALTEIDHLPGVKSAAAAMGLPAGQYGSNGKYGIEGVDIEHADWDHMPDAGFRLASRAYFQTLGVPLLAGREFNERDQYDAPFVAIVSQALVKQSFPDGNAIGKKIICGLDSPKWMTIVGVVGDVRSDGPTQAPVAELYMPFEQHPFHANELQIAVRIAGPPQALADTVIRKIRALSPDIALRTTTLQSMVYDSIASPRFRTFLISVFAGVALLLAMAGIYGLTAYLVTQRTPELGLRMALGSTPTGIVNLILSHTGLLAAAGLAAGIAVALLGTNLLKSMLFGVTATDISGYLLAAAAIAAITLGAAAVPAWRASRIDPAVALREE